MRALDSPTAGSLDRLQVDELFLLKIAVRVRMKMVMVTGHEVLHEDDAMYLVIIMMKMILIMIVMILLSSSPLG